MHVLDYILDRLSGLFRFNRYSFVEKAYSVLFHVVGLSFERYCITNASRESVRKWFHKSSKIIAMKFLRIVLGRCINKPLIIVDRGPWYRWALERLGIKYQHQRFGLRNAVERFFGYLKQRTRRFHNNINTWSSKSIEDYATAIIRNLTTAIKIQGDVLLG